MGFRFCKNLDTSMIKSITYKIHQYLANQLSKKVKMLPFYESGCWSRHCIYLFLIKVRIVGPCMTLAVKSPNRSVDILLLSQSWIHLIKDKVCLFPCFLQEWHIVSKEVLGCLGKNVLSSMLLQNRSYQWWVIVVSCKVILI